MSEASFKVLVFGAFISFLPLFVGLVIDSRITAVFAGIFLGMNLFIPYVNTITGLGKHGEGLWWKIGALVGLIGVFLLVFQDKILPFLVYESDLRRGIYILTTFLASSWVVFGLSSPLLFLYKKIFGDDKDFFRRSRKSVNEK